jgi:hypothetical protein
MQRIEKILDEIKLPFRVSKDIPDELTSSPENFLHPLISSYEYFEREDNENWVSLGIYIHTNKSDFVLNKIELRDNNSLKFIDTKNNTQFFKYAISDIQLDIIKNYNKLIFQIT